MVAAGGLRYIELTSPAASSSFCISCSELVSLSSRRSVCRLALCAQVAMEDLIMGVAARNKNTIVHRLVESAVHPIWGHRSVCPPGTMVHVW